MGLLDKLQAYIQANTPRSTRPVASPSDVINAGLLNPNQYNAPAANRFKDSAFGLLGAVPGAGDYASGVQAADYLNRGENGNALLAGLGALPIVPSLVGAGATLGGLGVMHKVAQKIGAPLPSGPARKQAGAIVYHGSPHNFDKFDISKVGTGEGKQAYGHGLYFAENQDVAKGYQKSTSYQDAVRQFRSELPDEADFAELVDLARSGQMSPQNARVVNALAADDWLGYDYPAQAITGAFKHGKSHDMSHELQAAINEYGSMYKVDIPDEAIPKMLDWDKPLSEQPHVIEAFRNAGYKPDLNMTAGDFMKSKSGEGMAQYLSFDLLKQGIPGIRYLDGNSRGTGGTSNFVLFDDDMARILEKNGKPTGLLSWADEMRKGKKP